MSVSNIFKAHSMANYTGCSLVKGNSFNDPSTVCVPSGSSEMPSELEHTSVSNILQQRLDDTAEIRALLTVYNPATAVSWWQMGGDRCSLAVFLVGTWDDTRDD